MTKILIVDDDEDISWTLKEALEEQGYETVIARNGQEALEVLKIEAPCLVLLDLMMPVMSGWEFLEQAEKHRLLDHSSVTVMSASGNPKVSRRITFLAKPFSLEAILDEARCHCLPKKETPLIF